MDITLIPELYKSLEVGEELVLVTIIATKGSTPRKTGSQMLMRRNGQVLGTIGGGCGEAEVKREAMHVFDTRQSDTYTVDMLNSIASEEGMACGGTMKVFLQFWG